MAAIRGGVDATTITTTVKSLPRATALLLALLTQLQHQWTLDSDATAVRTQLLRVGVSAGPSVRFHDAASTDTDIEVRGLAIGKTLYVHFVRTDAAVRLDLRLSDYTKEDATGNVHVDARTHVREGPWIINTEVLQWRLERSVFPVFRGATERADAVVRAGAELGRLPAPLVLRIAPFLTGREFCGITQTNKFLNEYADTQTIWAAYLATEFRGVRETAGVLASKALYVKLYRRTKRRVHAIRTAWGHLPPPPSYERPRPFVSLDALRLPDAMRPPMSLFEARIRSARRPDERQRYHPFVNHARYRLRHRDHEDDDATRFPLSSDAVRVRGQTLPNVPARRSFVEYPLFAYR